MKYSKLLSISIFLLFNQFNHIDAKSFIGLKANQTLKTFSIFEFRKSFYLNTDTAVAIQRKPKIDLAYRLESTDGVHAQRNIVFRVNNGSFEEIGWYGKPIRPYLKTDPEAYAQFLKYHRSRCATTFFLITTIGGLAAIGYSVIAGNSDDFVPPGGFVFGISFCAGYISSVIAMKHLHKAVRIYNQNEGYGYTDGLEKHRRE
jgi:hypothetical protein